MIVLKAHENNHIPNIRSEQVSGTNKFIVKKIHENDNRSTEAYK